MSASEENPCSMSLEAQQGIQYGGLLTAETDEKTQGILRHVAQRNC